MSNPYDNDNDQNQEVSPPVIHSEIDLANWGINDVAYVKSATINGQSGFTIHAADGTTVALATDKELAIAAVIQNDLQPVSLH